VSSGTRKISIAIVNYAYDAYLAGPTQVTLTTSWQSFKIAGTLATGQTGLRIVVRQYTGNGDEWTTGDIHLWGACLQQGDDPQAAYARGHPRRRTSPLVPRSLAPATPPPHSLTSTARAPIWPTALFLNSPPTAYSADLRDGSDLSGISSLHST